MPSPPLIVTTASTSPAATCCPVCTSISVTVPASGAVTVCCIFIASSTSTVWPALTSAPFSTATLITVPGIGASRLPLATASAGSVNRGTLVSRTCPAGPSTSTASDPTMASETSYVVRTPSASSVTAKSSQARR